MIAFMSEVIMRFRGREIRQADVEFLRELIARNPGLHRKALSQEVCRQWNWVQPNGHLRDMACRTLMLRLHRAEGEQLFNHLIEQHHYLGFRRPVVLLESFVDVERFKGTCYKAANWRCLGRSEGRGTKSQTGERVSLKELWAYPLVADLRGQLLP